MPSHYTHGPDYIKEQEKKKKKKKKETLWDKMKKDPGAKKHRQSHNKRLQEMIDNM